MFTVNIRKNEKESNHGFWSKLAIKTCLVVCLRVFKVYKSDWKGLEYLLEINPTMEGFLGKVTLELKTMLDPSPRLL